MANGDWYKSTILSLDSRKLRKIIIEDVSKINLIAASY